MKYRLCLILMVYISIDDGVTSSNHETSATESTKYSNSTHVFLHDIGWIVKQKITGGTIVSKEKALQDQRVLDAFQQLKEMRKKRGRLETVVKEDEGNIHSDDINDEGDKKQLPESYASQISNQKLLIVMLDAFRHDYPLNPNLSGFSRLLRESSRAPSVTPVFPSKTYPNMFSQVTGHYTEKHGVVDNNMFDPNHHELFYSSGSATEQQGIPIDVNGTHSFWWNESTPIWISAEAAGIKSAIYYWEGCQAEINGVNVSYCLPYESVVGKPWKEYIEIYDNILRDAFTKFTEHDYGLSMIYYEAIDATGHAKGIDSYEFREALRVTDDLITKITVMRKQYFLEDQLNIVLISDHGMMFPVEHTSKWVHLSKYLSSAEDSVPSMGSGTIVQIWPRDFIGTYVNLTRAEIDGGLTVAARGLDFKDHWNIERNSRTADILLIADYGYNINNFRADDWNEPGLHGFDPYFENEFTEDMKGILIASGPAFKKNFVLNKGVRMTDHYNVFCEVLGLRSTHCHRNNGSWNSVRSLFDDRFLISEKMPVRLTGSTSKVKVVPNQNMQGLPIVIIFILFFCSFVSLLSFVASKKRENSKYRFLLPIV